jgi:hypothetical protein
MNSKSAGILGIIGVIAALSISTPAGAVILASHPGAYADISHEWHYAAKTVCGYNFIYMQRMTIEGGPSEFAATDYITHPGHHKLISHGACNGLYLLALASCDCLQEPGSDPRPDPPPADRPKARPAPSGGRRD